MAHLNRQTCSEPQDMIASVCCGKEPALVMQLGSKANKGCAEEEVISKHSKLETTIRKIS
jgi:hypothetical protein